MKRTRIIASSELTEALPEVVALGAFVLDLYGRYPGLRTASDALDRITPEERARLLELEDAAETASEAAFFDYHQRRVDLMRGR